jgi:hypothetical protein
MEKGKFDKAFRSLCRLRKHKIQAARDMYYAYKLIEVEAAEREGRNPWKEFFGVRRNRRAAQSAFFVMFMQQFCGVNVCNHNNSNRRQLALLTLLLGHRLLLLLHLPRRRLQRLRSTPYIHGHRHN